MNTPYTQDDVNHLFHLLGQAVWYLQHLEKVMTTFNAMKILQRKRNKGTKITQEMAQKALDGQRAQTSGPLIAAAKREKTIPGQLISRFDEFLKERNWLIHKCVIEEYLSLRGQDSKDRLYARIEKFVEDAIALRRETYKLTESWYLSTGYDLHYAYSLAEELLKEAEKR